jgi:beta-lactamase regulating signal transducer with metallopeptidase domain
MIPLVLVRVTLVLLLALVSGALLRRHSASRRRIVWAAAVGTVLVLPLLSAAAPWQWEVQLPPVARGAGVPPAAPSVPTAGIEGAAALLPGVPSSGEGRDPGTVGGWATLLWLGGAVPVALFLLLGVARAAAWRRRAWEPEGETLRQAVAELAEGGGPPVRVTAALDGPATVGLIRPWILLPPDAEEWTRDRLHAVFLHEQAHVRQRDVPLQFLAGVACALYWFHPLVWMVRRNLRRDSERACDDAVLRGGLLPSTYAALLLELATPGRPFSGPLAAVSMARPGEFEGRLLAILDGLRDRRVPGWRFMSATAALFLLGGLLLSSVTPDQGRAETDLLLGEGVPPAGVAGGSDSSPGAQELVAALAPLLGDDDAGVRAAAAQALGEIRHGAFQALLAVVADPSAEVRKKVARALGELDDPRTLGQLSEYARSDPDRDVRRAAIRALGRSRAEGRVGALSGVLGGSDDGWTRVLAVKALGETRSPRAVAALEPLVAGEDGRLRREATEALAELGGGEARAALVRALSSHDPEVRSRAARGLGEERR